jgi:hypothetical protein
MKPIQLSSLAVGLYVFPATVEVSNFALRHSWPRFTSASSVIGFIGVGVWLFAASCMWRRPSWGWFPPVVGSLFALGHGAVLLAAGDRYASLPYLLTAFASFALLRRLILPYHGQNPLFAPPAKALPRRPLVSRHALA